MIALPVRFAIAMVTFFAVVVVLVVRRRAMGKWAVMRLVSAEAAAAQEKELETPITPGLGKDSEPVYKCTQEGQNLALYI